LVERYQEYAAGSFVQAMHQVRLARCEGGFDFVPEVGRPGSVGQQGDVGGFVDHQQIVGLMDDLYHPDPLVAFRSFSQSNTIFRLALRALNLRDLKYLVAVAEHRHFGRAADACFVSQPTLSTQLKKLEQELGVTLIERSNRQVMLTPVGARIVDQAQLVLREVNQLVHMAEEASDPLGGDFRLGVIPTVAPYLLPKILRPIAKTLPNLRVQLTEGQTAVITRLLRNGDLDAVILALPVDEDNVVARKLYTEPFLFAVSKQHPKAGNDSIQLRDLDGEQVLLLEDGHCLRDQALEVCDSHNAHENANFRATSIETLRQMVAAGVGTTLMPKLAVTRQAGTVRYIPFKGTPPHRDIGLCWRSTTSRVDLLEELSDLLVEALADA